MRSSIFKSFRILEIGITFIIMVILQLLFVGIPWEFLVTTKIWQNLSEVENLKQSGINCNSSVIMQKGGFLCVSRGKKCSFFGKFCMLCFFVTSVLRFALLIYYRQIIYFKFLSAIILRRLLSMKFITIVVSFVQPLSVFFIRTAVYYAAT